MNKTMKNAILPLLAVSGQLFAQSFLLTSGDRVQLAYQDADLSSSQKAMIGADVQRTVAPGLVFASLEPYTNRPGGHLVGLFVPEDSEGTPSLTSEVAISGTNIVLTVGKNYTDSYLSRMAFFNTHSNAIYKAFAFADLLATNPVAGMPSNQLQGIRLTKKHPPGQIPLGEIEEMRNDLGAGTYYHPSLLGFQMLPYGPCGSEQYLWGVLPNRLSDSVDSIPVVYYQNRWWISYWILEEEVQGW